ncbi:MAG: chemotaxis response regulator protein-glutamate methylesterase [Planctomycetes bacterium]|nr:chemotaxis response regulator protein-glutamate methylesterase [Planctomycetota bacterium]
MAKIRVLVVDDSAVVRKILCDTLEVDDEFDVVGTAANGRLALTQVEALQPDVVTLDIEMPEMDGVETARQLHQRWPKLPLIMFSTLSQRGATATLEALGAGAVDYVTKPSNSASLQEAMQLLRDDLFSKLKQHGGRSAARRATPAPIAPIAPRFVAPAPAPHPVAPPAATAPEAPPAVPSQAPTDPDFAERRSKPRPPGAPLWSSIQRESFRSKIRGLKLPGPAALPPPRAAAPTAPPHAFTPAPPAPASFPRKAARLAAGDTPEIVAIGVSTGGPPALNALLPAIPASFPLPIVIVQHMPPLFTKLLAQQLATKCQVKVHEAEPGMVLEPGHVYIAPGDYHMVVERAGTQLRLALNQDAPENSCRPAVDPLFRSVARCYGKRVLAVVLTGMGADGMKGAEVIKQAGGSVLAQDEKSSVVWGMPGFVANRGLADAVLPLSDMAAEILCRVPSSGRASGKVPVTS